LEAVITAKTDAAASKTHDAVKKICSVIIGAYEKTKDPYASHEEKISAVSKVTTLNTEIGWLVEFTRTEADWCKTPEIHKKMDHIAQTIQVHHSQLQTDFTDLKHNHDSQTFMVVFDKILSLLEHITEFLKQGHAAEVCRVMDNGVFAFAEAKNMLDLELKHLLVQQAKNMKDRTGEFLKKTSNLVNIQEGQNKGLKERVQNVERILDGHCTTFVLKTRDDLVENTQYSKNQRHAAYEDLKACLDEINKILQRIKAKYSNLFEEGPLLISQNYEDLDQAAYDVMNTLAKLHVPATTPELEAEKIEAARMLPKHVQQLMSVMAMAGADDDVKRDLIAAIKKARDGGLPEYFNAMQTLEDLVRKGMSAPPMMIIPDAIVDLAKPIQPTDMLEAAKRMCAALKGLNLALDD
jgi:hypothetical protein